MTKMTKISSSGNVEPPLYQIIRNKGFTIDLKDEIWIARKDHLELRGDNIFELAGLILLYENSGSKWTVDDDLIDEYLIFLEKKGEIGSN